MSEETKSAENLRWKKVAKQPEVFQAIQYLVIEEKGKKFSNFENILKMEGVNGRVYQQDDVVRVSSGNDRMTLRSGHWLVMDPLSNFAIYSDAQYKILFDSGMVVTDISDESIEIAPLAEKPAGITKVELESRLEENAQEIMEAVRESIALELAKLQNQKTTAAAIEQAKEEKIEKEEAVEEEVVEEEKPDTADEESGQAEKKPVTKKKGGKNAKSSTSKSKTTS